MFSIVAAGAFFALRWLLDVQIDWPGRFLPSRWSDFEFWPELWEAERANFDKAALLLPLPKDMMWRENMSRLLVCLIAACFLAARFARSPARIRMPFAAISACTALVTLALIAFGMEFIPPRSYYIAPAAFWATRLALIRRIRNLRARHLNEAVQNDFDLQPDPPAANEERII